MGANVEDGERSQLENLVGWAWDWMKVQRRQPPPIRAFELYQIRSTNSYRRESLQVLRQKKSWQQSVNAKKEVAVKHRYINEYLGMSEAAYIAEREAAGVIPTARLAVTA